MSIVYLKPVINGLLQKAMEYGGEKLITKANDILKNSSLSNHFSLDDPPLPEEPVYTQISQREEDEMIKDFLYSDEFEEFLMSKNGQRRIAELGYDKRIIDCTDNTCLPPGDNNDSVINANSLADNETDANKNQTEAKKGKR